MPDSRVLRDKSVAFWARRQRRRNDVASLIGWLKRERCVRCGARERHSWAGNWWPSGWFCKPCTERWMEES